MFAILKKEFKSYFLSPIGYVVIGIFLFVFSVFFYLTVISSPTVDLGALYYYTALYGLIITVPILTMRMFAEERKTGTEQLILTSPVGITGVVFGKFLAAMTVIVIALLVSFMYFGIVCYFGTPSILVLLATMLGFLLISAAAIAVGMFASCITENQIIAGVITIAFMIITLFTPDLNITLPFCTQEYMYNGESYYQNFPTGVISLTDVAGPLTLMMMFIAFTIIVMQRRKLVK